MVKIKRTDYLGIFCDCRNYNNNYIISLLGFLSDMGLIPNWKEMKTKEKKDKGLKKYTKWQKMKKKKMKHTETNVLEDHLTWHNAAEDLD